MSAEVDTGSDCLNLNMGFMDELCIRKGAPETKVTEGTDETGHAYVRYFARLEGPVSFLEVPEISQRDLMVIF